MLGLANLYLLSEYCFYGREKIMSLTFLKILLILGIIGHGINMYCDRVLSIFPNGKLTFASMNDLGDHQKLAHLMDGVPATLAMRSAILGAFSLVLQLLGYTALSAYMYQHSTVYGTIMFLAIVIFIVVGTAHHVKYALSEYLFIKLGRDKKAHTVMMDLFNAAPITRICYVAYIVFIITMIIAVLTGTAAVPLWAAIFTILPVFIIMFPFRIIGTLHISAMVSMLVWIFLI